MQWWRENVRGDGRPSKTSPDLGRFPVEKAEELTGITSQQVSKWAKRLQEPARSRRHAAIAGTPWGQYGSADRRQNYAEALSAAARLASTDLRFSSAARRSCGMTAARYLAVFCAKSHSKSRCARSPAT